MNGATVTGWLSFGILPTEWRIVAAADFTGDGNPDILWEDTATGVRGIWVMNGLTVAGWISFGGVPTNWHIVAAADFTGDGQTDILWQDLNTGVVGIWRMTGTTINGWTSFGGVPTEWHAVGAGHFSGNATPDVIWEDVNTGLRGIWLMNTTTVAGWVPFGGVPTNWHIAGAGQFLGENPADNVLWTDEDTGVAGIWTMSGTTVTGWVAMGAVPTQWQPRGVFPVLSFSLAYGTATEKVHVLDIGGAYTPSLTALLGGVPQPPESVAFVSRATSVATVDATGRITGVGPGQSWVSATGRGVGDSVFVIVTQSPTGPLLRTNLSTYSVRSGDTFVVTFTLDGRGTLVGAATVVVGYEIENGMFGLISAQPPIQTPQPVSSSSIPGLYKVTVADATGLTAPVDMLRLTLVAGASGLSGFLTFTVLDIVAPDGTDLGAITTSTRYPVIIR